LIRKVYLDFMLEKMSDREFGWLLSRGMQYALTHASYLLRRPLCGPILGTVVTNYRCNYRCSMCALHLRDEEFRAKGIKELDTAHMKLILKDFAAQGTSGIGFTGGEPLLRKDIFELLAYTKALGMISHLNTNGSLLDERNIGNILNVLVDSLNISLDGARAETHDAIRGHRGAFDRAIEAISLVIAMRKRKGTALRLKTVAVLQKDNIDEVAGMVRLAEDLGVDCIEFIPLQPFAAGIDHQSPPDPLFLGKVQQVTDYLLGLGKKTVRIENSRTHIKLFHRSFSNVESPLKCYAGYNSLAVDCYGEIYPCVPWFNWRRSVGNIRDKDFAEFWYSPEYQRFRQEIRSCRKCYLNCQAELNVLFNIGRPERVLKG